METARSEGTAKTYGTRYEEKEILYGKRSVKRIGKIREKIQNDNMAIEINEESMDDDEWETLWDIF